MSHAIRAIYGEGQLHLLDPVDLTEGQEIQVLILSNNEHARIALGDLLVEVPTVSDDTVDELALMREIEIGFRGQSLSNAIIEERLQGHEPFDQSIS